MRTLTREIWMEVPQRRAIVSIQREVEQLVAESGVQDGLVLVNAMHITASVFINDNESGLHADYERWLEELVPFNAGAIRPRRLPAQPHRRRQRRRPPQAADHGPRSGRRDHRRQAAPGTVGAHFLLRVRRATTEAGAGEDHRGVIAGYAAARTRAIMYNRENGHTLFPA